MSKRLKIVFIFFISLYIIMCLLIRVFFNFQYQTAKELFNDGEYQASAEIFDKLVFLVIVRYIFKVAIIILNIRKV